MTDETDRISFSHSDDFEAAAPTGGLGLGPLEIQYQELFAEALEDGVITVDERARLHRAAANLGLDVERLERLEDAMTAAYETHHRVRVIDHTFTPHTSLAPLVEVPPLLGTASAPPPVTAAKSTALIEVSALRAENESLKQRVSALEAELLRAQAAVNVEVELDLSGLEAAATSSEDPEEVWRRVRNEPTDAEAHRALLVASDQAGDEDGKYLCAAALVALGQARPEEAALVEKHRPQGLIAPRSSLDDSIWRSCLMHPEQEAVTGSIFSVIAPAILVGRVTTLRRDGLLHQPNPESRQDPTNSTIMAVRAVGWAAALLGLAAPRTYTEPATDMGYAHAAGLPPHTVLGKRALSGPSIPELAFAVGRHLSGYRSEHFVRTLYSATEDLEDLFLGALLVANPRLPLKGPKRARIEPLARAMEPLLEPTALDALRGHYMRFAEEGGRTNLQRWSSAVDKTAARVGLALCQDLPTALSALRAEEPDFGPLSLDLLAYATSARFKQVRRALGVSVGAE